MTRPAPAAPSAAGAIDLGSTVIKAGVLGIDGRLIDVQGIEAPPLSGDGDTREGDATAYAEAADRLIAWLRSALPPGSPVGIASQRSTFLLWDRESRAPLIPMISWQDRRAAGWCGRNEGLEALLSERTGLVLSAHYVGPKLAALLEESPTFARCFHDSGSVFGTLDSFTVSRWTGERDPETDVTMAARTAMFDLELGQWSDPLLSSYGVPREALPRIRPTIGPVRPLDNGLQLAASIADQASGALTLLEEQPECAVVILGTGAFVMRPAKDGTERIPGYLTAPVLAREGVPTTFVLEGPVNGAGTAVDRFGSGPTSLPPGDSTPDAFCLPDAAGLGAPYWRPEIGFTLSPSAELLPVTELRRVAIEGVLFRVRQVLEDLSAVDTRRIVVAGGLTREPAIASGLANLLERPVHLLGDREAVLLGASRLAAGMKPYASSPTTRVQPGRGGSYLPSKYDRWRDWVEELLVRPH